MGWEGEDRVLSKLTAELCGSPGPQGRGKRAVPAERKHTEKDGAISLSEIPSAVSCLPARPPLQKMFLGPKGLIKQRWEAEADIFYWQPYSRILHLKKKKSYKTVSTDKVKPCTNPIQTGFPHRCQEGERVYSPKQLFILISYYGSFGEFAQTPLNQLC